MQVTRCTGHVQLNPSGGDLGNRGVIWATSRRARRKKLDLRASRLPPGMLFGRTNSYNKRLAPAGASMDIWTHNLFIVVGMGFIPAWLLGIVAGILTVRWKSRPEQRPRT